ncbi:DoxX family membrane protein [Desulfosporosinus sp. PR]|uniref:DoxX family membrane protein n=1 Tax=Candidatus Desulfosporosinus nitrosoreducens TaxID=3401928 RepID=UPI0027FFECAC|nr:DoxX family membrane protein [Desulfosporosinus sp. PR]MDQ7092821.1 DoxX family membrane protein [Desulfosporosinus sp. PR]
MTAYSDAVKAKFKDGKVAFLVIIFTVARLIYGWAWVTSGFEKLTTWFTDGKLNSAGKIGTLITNIAGPKVTSFDPLYINKAFAWLAQNVFLGMPQVTDTLVVIFEISVGVCMILGFRIFWTALVAIFMNLQFFGGGSFNNFGYVWTDLAMLKFAQYAELLGVSGYLKYRKNRDLLEKGQRNFASAAGK